MSHDSIDKAYCLWGHLLDAHTISQHTHPITYPIFDESSFRLAVTNGKLLLSSSSYKRIPSHPSKWHDKDDACGVTLGGSIGKTINLYTWYNTEHGFVATALDPNRSSAAASWTTTTTTRVVMTMTPLQWLELIVFVQRTESHPARRRRHRHRRHDCVPTMITTMIDA